MSTWTDRATGTADRMARTFGAPVTLVKVTLGAYDDATRRQASTTTVYNLGFGRLQRQVLRDEDGRLTQTDKREVVIPISQLPSGIVPSKADKLVLRGQQYEILDVDVAGSEAYEYKLEVEA